MICEITLHSKPFPCLQIAHKYLVDKHLSPADTTKFKEQLYRIWFELYARRGSSRWVESGTEPKHTVTSAVESGIVVVAVLTLRNCNTSSKHDEGVYPLHVQDGSCHFSTYCDRTMQDFVKLAILNNAKLQSSEMSRSFRGKKISHHCIEDEWDISMNEFVVWCSPLRLPPGRTPRGSNTCLLERREEAGPWLAFTTGSSSTCRRSWDTSITKATVSLHIHPRYAVWVLNQDGQIKSARSKLWHIVNNTHAWKRLNKWDKPFYCLLRPSQKPNHEFPGNTTIYIWRLMLLCLLFSFSSPLLPQVDSRSLWSPRCSCTLMRNLTFCCGHVHSLSSCSAALWMCFF